MTSRSDTRNKSFSMRHLIPLFCAMLMLGHSVAAGDGHDHDHQHAAPTKAFVENLGQWQGPFQFKGLVRGASLFVEKDGWTWSMLEPSAADRMHDIAELTAEEQRSLRFNGHAWRMRYVGGKNVVTKGLERATYHHSYFLGNDPARWRGQVGVYGGLIQEAVWPDIDVVLSTVDGHLKYDIVLAPGADQAQVALAYEGLDGMELTEDGSLRMITSVGDVTEMAPVAFYGDGPKETVPCRFIVEGRTVRFAFPNGYDRTRSLIIDPVLVAGTYSGATGSSNYGHCATYDNQGNIYTGARNFGPTYPATVGAFQTTEGGGGTDITLSKYNPDGSELIWASYLGGSSGENPHSLITNAQGELIVLASTSSADFPITSGAFDNTIAGQDIAVVHIAADATYLEGSTFLGGSGSDGTNNMFANYGEAYRGEVYTDQTGNILITSFTSSTDFPVTAGAIQGSSGGDQDGVVAKLDPSCSQLLASTYLGGSSDDNAMGIRLASNGEVYITGATESSDFPMPSGGAQATYIGGERDGYVLRLSADLTTIIAGTFFGTTSSDRPYFLDIDSNDDVWIYGQTSGQIPTFPEGTYGGPGGNVFVAKVLGDMSEVPVTTMIPGNTVPVAFLVDVCDHVYISGYNTNGSMPTTPDALHTTGSFFLASFDVEMSDILFGTYYGGSHVDGGTSRFDKNGIVYQGVCSGGQSMQSTPWAYATSNQIPWDIAVFKIDFETAGVQANIVSTGITGCVPATFVLDAVGAADEFFWDLGDGSPLQSGEQITVSFDEAGTYLITLIGTDPESCNVSDTTSIVLNVFDPSSINAAFELTPESTCDGYFLQTSNNSIGATQYIWDFGDGSTAIGQAPNHEYAQPGTYQVSLLAVNSICIDTAAATLPVTFVIPQLELDLPSPVALCNGASVQLDAGSGYDSYAWSSGASTRFITVSEQGTYDVQVTDGSCIAMDTVDVVEVPQPPITPDLFKCANDSAFIAPAYTVASIQWSTGSTALPLAVIDAGEYYFTAVDAYGCDSDGLVRVVEIPIARPDNFIPNVFSPNGDNLNDRFQVVGEGLDRFSMEIFDRWGLKMYESSNQFIGWNGGLDNGTSAAVPDGTYYYVIGFSDQCADEPFTTRTGHVTLLR